MLGLVPKTARFPNGVAGKWKVSATFWILELSAFGFYRIGQYLEKKMKVIQEKVRYYFDEPLIWICVGLTRVVAADSFVDYVRLLFTSSICLFGGRIS